MPGCPPAPLSGFSCGIMDWIVSTASGFHSGSGSIPCLVRKSAICARRPWFGRTSRSGSTAPVLGLVLCSCSHRIIASRSYECLFSPTWEGAVEGQAAEDARCIGG